MFFSNGYINRLRIVSFWLFFVPLFALIFSLLFHNLIVEFKASSKLSRYNVSFPKTINCNYENFYCVKLDLNLPAQNFETFDNCNKYVVGHHYVRDGKVVSKNSNYPIVSGLLKFDVEAIPLDYLSIWSKLQRPKDLDLTIVYFETKELTIKCIKNSKFYDLYKIFPKFFYFIERTKQNKKFSAGTSTSVNPFIYGEVSISNIVKRYPINYLFKPLLFITSFLMIFYWLTYQKIFWNITKEQKINKFTIFGVLSGLFLFFHVFFLGSTIDNDVFQKVRKLILVLFIIFEILAQFFLTKRLYLNIDKFNEYISKKILNVKIIFVSLIVLSSIIIIGILSFNNLDSKVDYILEWNYFSLLLLFYLLSTLLWNKKDKNSIL
mgnify:FL=1